MRSKTTIMTTLALALASGVAVGDDDPTLGEKKVTDLSKSETYVGFYQIKTGEDDGDPIPPDRLSGHVVRITEDMIVVLDGEENTLYSCKYSLVHDADPIRLDMESTGGPPGSVGQKAKGIITKGTNDEGESFVMLCYRTIGDDYPEEFRTRAQTETNLFVLEPVPDPKDDGAAARPE